MSGGLSAELPLSSVARRARRDTRVVTIRRTTLVRLGVVALVLVALGIGTAIGLTVSSTSSPPATHTDSGGSKTRGGSTTTVTRPLTSTTTTNAASLPVVLSCGPTPTKTIRPTTLTIGCALGATTVTSITWKAWDSGAGGQGSGLLNLNNCQPDCAHGTVNSVPAIVVVFHIVSGVFQDVSITPSQNVPSTPKPPATTSTTLQGANPGTFPNTTTTSTTTSGPAPVFASQPGSGWGGN